MPAPRTGSLGRDNSTAAAFMAHQTISGPTPQRNRPPHDASICVVPLCPCACPPTPILPSPAHGRCCSDVRRPFGGRGGGGALLRFGKMGDGAMGRWAMAMALASGLQVVIRGAAASQCRGQVDQEG